MPLSRPARLFFALTAATAFVGLIVQLFATADLDTGFFDTSWKRVLNVFCFFTIQSNIIVGVTTLFLAAGWARPTLFFRTLRLIGVVGISVTFVVFQVALRSLQDLTGQAAFADFMLHTACPVLCVAGWLWFGPRGQTSARVALWTLAFPAIWGVFTLIRGEMIGFYPYPFINAQEHGYARIGVNLLVISAVFAGLSFGAHLLDPKLPKSGHGR